MICCGQAGDGFKVAPVLGEALADLAMKSDPSIDVSSYSLDRFGNRYRQSIMDRF
jgi:glycine/D-amino acid oxidase-like deaminating enzyme